MKTIKFLLALIVTASLMTACDTDIESKDIQKPYTYSPLYYQNLRDYKASDHSIAFMWFAQYGAQNSMAVRFAGLPDSLDICSLWGGIPAPENTQLWEELRFVQCGHQQIYRDVCRVFPRSGVPQRPRRL